MVRTCFHCGFVDSEGLAHDCPRCGTPFATHVSDIPSPPPPPFPDLATRPVSNALPPPFILERSAFTRKRSIWPMLIIFGTLIVLLGGGMVVYAANVHIPAMTASADVAHLPPTATPSPTPAPLVSYVDPAGAFTMRIPETFTARTTTTTYSSKAIATTIFTGPKNTAALLVFVGQPTLVLGNAPDILAMQGLNQFQVQQAPQAFVSRMGQGWQIERAIVTPLNGSIIGVYVGWYANSAHSYLVVSLSSAKAIQTGNGTVYEHLLDTFTSRQ